MLFLEYDNSKENFWWWGRNCPSSFHLPVGRAVVHYAISKFVGQHWKPSVSAHVCCLWYYGQYRTRGVIYRVLLVFNVRTLLLSINCLQNESFWLPSPKANVFGAQTPNVFGAFWGEGWGRDRFICGYSLSQGGSCGNHSCSSEPLLYQHFPANCLACLRIA